MNKQITSSDNKKHKRFQYVFIFLPKKKTDILKSDILDMPINLYCIACSSHMADSDIYEIFFLTCKKQECIQTVHHWHVAGKLTMK